MTRCPTGLADAGTETYFEEWLRDLQEELNEAAAAFWTARNLNDCDAEGEAAERIRIICFEMPFALRDLEAAKDGRP